MPYSSLGSSSIVAEKKKKTEKKERKKEKKRVFLRQEKFERRKGDCKFPVSGARLSCSLEYLYIPITILSYFHNVGLLSKCHR